jgi:hypothetical protein
MVANDDATLENWKKKSLVVSLIVKIWVYFPSMDTHTLVMHTNHQHKHLGRNAHWRWVIKNHGITSFETYDILGSTK